MQKRIVLSMSCRRCMYSDVLSPFLVYSYFTFGQIAQWRKMVSYIPVSVHFGYGHLNVYCLTTWHTSCLSMYMVICFPHIGHLSLSAHYRHITHPQSSSTACVMNWPQLGHFALLMGSLFLNNPAGYRGLSSCACSSKGRNVCGVASYNSRSTSKQNRGLSSYSREYGFPNIKNATFFSRV